MAATWRIDWAGWSCQESNGGALVKGGDSREGEKWLDPGYISEVTWIRLSDG